MTILGAYTDKGLVKQVDQDACCFLEAHTLAGHAVMAIVCDGVGGLEKGELASATVVRRFSDWFQRQFPLFIEYNASDEALMDLLRNVWDTLLQISSEDIYRYSSSNNVMLGTTFTGMIVIGSCYLIGHVGDCRAYEVTDSGVVQLTHDQTLVAQQVAAGLLAPEEAATHPKRNVILQSVGTSAGVEVEFVKGDYDSKATYVLCCDGLYNRLAAEELASRFSPSTLTSEEQLQESCEQLASDIMSRGEKDNITVLAFSDAVPGVVAAATSAPRVHAADEDGESPTFIADVDESPTIVVKGGGHSGEK